MSQLSRILGLLFVAVILSACEPVADPEAARADLLQRNPALAATQVRDPALFEYAFSEISRLRPKPTRKGVRLPPKYRGIGNPTPEEKRNKRLREILLQNPALLEVYKKDPDATTKLIDVILG